WGGVRVRLVVAAAELPAPQLGQVQGHQRDRAGSADAAVHRGVEVPPGDKEAVPGMAAARAVGVDERLPRARHGRARRAAGLRRHLRGRADPADSQLSYVDDVAEDIRRQLAPDLLPEGDSAPLFRLYALL